MIASWGDEQQALSDSTAVLLGAKRGAYPSGNSLYVRGASDAAIIDPSVTVVEIGGAPGKVDAVINSHAHEDHMAGNSFFKDAAVHIHEGDLSGAKSLDGLLDIYGLEGEPRESFGKVLAETFFFDGREDSQGFEDGHVWDLGGGVRIEAVHLPGHTRGHSGFRIGGDVFFLSDIDLTGFGPYYGDVWSSLDDFEESLVKVRDEDAKYYVTSHQKGVIEGRAAFVELLDKYGAVIGRRHDEMLAFLEEPRTLADMVKRRFVYRPHVKNDFVNHVEHRTAELHVERMLARGECREVEPGVYAR